MIFREKLEKIATRCEEIEKQLASPDVVKDQNQFQQLNKELSRLRPIYRAFDSYKQVCKELGDVGNLLEDPQNDKEMKTLYQEEKSMIRLNPRVAEKIAFFILLASTLVIIIPVILITLMILKNG